MGVCFQEKEAPYQDERWALLFNGQLIECSNGKSQHVLLQRIKREMDLFVYYWIAKWLPEGCEKRPRHHRGSETHHRCARGRDIKTAVRGRVRTRKTTSWNHNVDNERRQTHIRTRALAHTHTIQILQRLNYEGVYHTYIRSSRSCLRAWEFPSVQHFKRSSTNAGFSLIPSPSRNYSLGLPSFLN